MRTKYFDVPMPKTLGSQAARLLEELYETGRTIFSVRDVQEITGLTAKSAANLAGKLVLRGVASRLKPGRFILVPFELGREREYLGNPYLVARALAGDHQYFLSHASAMDMHRMVTQPQLVVYTSSPFPLRGRTILGTEFRFVRCKREHLFGLTELWIDKTEKVVVSDLERTVIDGLKQPEYCGGVVEVAKGYWMRRPDMNTARLVEYALRLGVGAVIRRLGFVLETYGVQDLSEIERLRGRLTETYHLLDPTLPAEGRRVARWRLRVNVSAEEMEAARST
jgi:predicted transcriptional regulator of viral defense system